MVQRPIIYEQRVSLDPNIATSRTTNITQGDAWRRTAKEADALSAELFNGLVKEQEKLGIDEANAVSFSDVTTIDSETGLPKALDNISSWSNTRRNAYTAIVKDRFSKGIYRQMLSFSHELKNKVQFNEDAINDYERGMKQYQNSRIKNSNDEFYQNKIIEHSSQIISDTRADLVGIIQTRKFNEAEASLQEELTLEVQGAYSLGFTGASNAKLFEHIANTWNNNMNHEQFGLLTTRKVSAHESSMAQSFIAGKLERYFQDFELSYSDAVNIMNSLIDPTKLYLLDGDYFVNKNGSRISKDRGMLMVNEVKKFHNIINKYDINKSLIMSTMAKMSAESPAFKNIVETDKSNTVYQYRVNDTPYPTGSSALSALHMSSFYEVDTNGELQFTEDGNPKLNADFVASWGINHNESGVPTKIVNGEVVEKPEAEWSEKERLRYNAISQLRTELQDNLEIFLNELRANETIFNVNSLNDLRKIYDHNRKDFNLPQVYNDSELINSLMHFMFSNASKDSEFTIPDSLRKQMDDMALYSETEKIIYPLNAKVKDILELTVINNKQQNFKDMLNKFFKAERDALARKAENIGKLLDEEEQQIEAVRQATFANEMTRQRNIMQETWRNAPINIEAYLILKNQHDEFKKLMANSEYADLYKSQEDDFNKTFEELSDDFLAQLAIANINGSGEFLVGDVYADTDKIAIYNANSIIQKEDMTNTIIEILQNGYAIPKELPQHIQNTIQRLRTLHTDVRGKLITEAGGLNDFLGELQEKKSEIESNLKKELELQRASLLIQAVGEGAMTSTAVTTAVNENEPSLNILWEQYISQNGGIGLSLLNEQSTEHNLLKTYLLANKLPPNIEQSFVSLANGKMIDQDEAVVLFQMFNHFGTKPYITDNGVYTDNNYMKVVLGDTVYQAIRDINDVLKVVGTDITGVNISDVVTGWKDNISAGRAKFKEIESDKDYLIKVDNLVSEYFGDVDPLARRVFKNALIEYLGRDISTDEAIQAVLKYQEEIFVEDELNIMATNYAGTYVSHHWANPMIFAKTPEERRAIFESMLSDALVEESFTVEDFESGGGFGIGKKSKEATVKGNLYTTTEASLDENNQISTDIKRYILKIGDYESFNSGGFGRKAINENDIEVKQLYVMPMTDTNGAYNSMGSLNQIDKKSLSFNYIQFRNHVEYILVERNDDGELVPFMPNGEVVVKSYMDLNKTLRDIAAEKQVMIENMSEKSWKQRQNLEEFYKDGLTVGIGTN